MVGDREAVKPRRDVELAMNLDKTLDAYEYICVKDKVSICAKHGR